jgi:hypothetical protein
VLVASGVLVWTPLALVNLELKGIDHMRLFSNSIHEHINQMFLGVYLLLQRKNLGSGSVVSCFTCFTQVIEHLAAYQT